MLHFTITDHAHLGVITAVRKFVDLVSKNYMHRLWVGARNVSQRLSAGRSTFQYVPVRSVHLTHNCRPTDDMHGQYRYITKEAKKMALDLSLVHGLPDSTIHRYMGISKRSLRRHCKMFRETDEVIRKSLLVGRPRNLSFLDVEVNLNTLYSNVCSGLIAYLAQ